MSDRTRSIGIVAAAAVLVILVAAVFYPMLGFDFVGLDTTPHIASNPHIRGLTWENLVNILTKRWITSYRPVRTLSYAIDYQLWGLNPAGFNFTNGLIHTANVLLVFWLIMRFFVWPAGMGDGSSASANVLPAALATAVFAVHPVVVEPVAWVSGREELLMTFGCLACVHFHLTARRLTLSGGNTGRIVACHALAVFACMAACLSNIIGAIIPFLILAIDFLIFARLTLWRVLSGTCPLVFVSAVALFMRKVEEASEPAGEVAAVSLARLAMVFNSYCLNLKSLIWPVDLAIFYPPISPNGFTDAEVVCGIAAAALTVLAIWAVWRQKVMVLGLVWFLLALAPSSQILVHHIHRADRFLYLPLAGLAVSIACALRAIGLRLPPRAARTAAIAGSAVLLLLASLSARQVQTWRDGSTMWANCVRVSPQDLRFQQCLAISLARDGRTRMAVEQYQRILRSNPGCQSAAIRLARLLATTDDRRVRDLNQAFQLAEAAYSRNPIFFRAAADIRTLLAEAQAEGGQFALAIEGYRYALDRDPANQRATLQLALLLATCGDESLRKPGEALSLAERSDVLYQLSRRLAARPRDFGAAERFLAMADVPDDSALIEDLRRRLRSWVEAHP